MTRLDSHTWKQNEDTSLETERAVKHANMPLFQALQAYEQDATISFDVPGHKRGIYSDELVSTYGKTVLRHDVNSMPRLDNLANATGVIKEAQELLADAYGADHAYFLVNGTTLGIQAMILSICQPKDKIIVPRNVHKSVVSALVLGDIQPIYVCPAFDEDLGIAHNVSFDEVAKAIEEHPDAKGIFLINPTYYGATADLEKIIGYAHERGLPVLVDEAHGAHFPFHQDLPISAMEAGADMAAISLHKTGGAFTQASALLTQGSRIDREKVQQVLNMLTSTSASYLLMGSIDVARKNLVLHGEERFQYLFPLIQATKKQIRDIPGFDVLTRESCRHKGVHDFDETKLTIAIEANLGLNGFDVYHMLCDEYNIQMELAEPNIVMAVITYADNEDTLAALVQALADISLRHFHEDVSFVRGTPSFFPEKTIQATSVREAFYGEKESVLLEKALHRVCGEALMIYPPGIPILMPGEVITQEVIDYCEFLQHQDTIMIGTNHPNEVTVLKDGESSSLLSINNEIFSKKTTAFQ